jgi:hypothetical protein
MSLQELFVLLLVGGIAGILASGFVRPARLGLAGAINTRGDWRLGEILPGPARCGDSRRPDWADRGRLHRGARAAPAGRLPQVR